VSIIDTRSDKIVRVFPTGPIPKYVAISPDNKLAAITHWGDNTLGLIDMPSDDPATWKYRPERLIVEQALPQENLSGNRDAACGMCLRGTVFTPDNRYLLVTRMGDGGIAGFDLQTNTFLGTVDGEQPTPRHMVISPDGRWLYLTSNKAGVVAKIELNRMIEALQSAKGGHVVLNDRQEVDVGSGARTLELSPDGKRIYVALNSNAELVAIDAATMTVQARVRTDAYTVGLAVSPDGRQVWTTSQGNSGKGGNSVCVYEVSAP
jgi:YVTN family beta-propeller protein